MQVYPGKSILSCPRGSKSLGIMELKKKTNMLLFTKYIQSFHLWDALYKVQGNNDEKIRHGPSLLDLLICLSPKYWIRM